MKKIFFIAFEFPPLNNGGVFRPMAIVKRLSKSYKIVVFTLHPNSIENFFGENNFDTSLEFDLNENIDVIQITVKKLAKKSKIKKFFDISDRDTKEWEQKAKEILINKAKQEKPDLLLVTAPPFTMASFGRKISKELKIPMVLDLRDAWSLWNISPYRSWFHYFFTKIEERKCLNHSEIVFVTSEQTKRDLISLHSNLSLNKVQVITNGFESRSSELSQVKNINQKIVIGYVGGFYYSPESRDLMLKKWYLKRPTRWLNYTPRKEDWLYRTPYFFFRTLQALFERNEGFKKIIEIQFIGKKPNWFDKMVSQFELNDVVFHLGEYSHTNSLKFQQECDVLLITSSKVIGAKDYSIAGKTFEYISMLKPILAFVCAGAQKDILEQTGLAIICNPDDIFGSVNVIEEFIYSKNTLEPKFEFIDHLSRNYQIKEMEKFLNSMK